MTKLEEIAAGKAMLGRAMGATMSLEELIESAMYELLDMAIAEVQSTDIVDVPGWDAQLGDARATLGNAVKALKSLG